MSTLKKQLAVILPLLSEEANHNRDPDVKYRLYALKAIVESKKDVKKAKAKAKSNFQASGEKDQAITSSRTSAWTRAN